MAYADPDYARLIGAWKARKAYAKKAGKPFEEPKPPRPYRPPTKPEIDPNSPPPVIRIEQKEVISGVREHCHHFTLTPDGLAELDELPSDEMRDAVHEIAQALQQAWGITYGHAHGKVRAALRDARNEEYAEAMDTRRKLIHTAAEATLTCMAAHISIAEIDNVINQRRLEAGC